MKKYKHPQYNRWKCMVQRCYNRGNVNYQWYGARGIRVCARWRIDFWAFASYIDRALGECPDGYTLDRINNDQGYKPGNLRWADLSTQNRNKRR